MMITANEAFKLVSSGQSYEDLIQESDDIKYACELIKHYINHGWLCVNLSSKMELTTKVKRYLDNLGYMLDKDGICYWMFQNND